MKLGIPPEVIFKLMKHHGIRDGALEQEMEGSGIFDTLKDLAKSAVSSVKDGAKGWSSTIKNNMPNMSDVRRGVDKIVPDSLQKYLPDSIKTTIGDKAKDFFGFGASENGGIPIRHREPFSVPNVDKWGYNQGAAERMRTMSVDKELVSGLRRLTAVTHFGIPTLKSCVVPTITMSMFPLFRSRQYTDMASMVTRMTKNRAA